MEEVLKDLDFSVTKRIDLKSRNMQKEIERFLLKIMKHDIVFFYFSRHGFTRNKKAYIQSIDSNGVSVHDFIDSVERKGCVTLCVMDCCRNRTTS